MHQDKKGPTIVVVGSGLAGLLTSLNIRRELPTAQVTVLEKAHPQSNTQIAGMRFRLKKSGSPADDLYSYAEDIIRLLSERNKNVLLPQMVDFAYIAVKEITRLNQLLREVDSQLVTEDSAWFGPQWGIVNQSGEGGRGSSILITLRRMASESGIRFITGEATNLSKEGRNISGINYLREGVNTLLLADEVVLANGNAGGSLYESTSKVINSSATELLFQAGLPIEGGTLNMWHPFGHCTKEGQSRTGCFETDSLAGAKIWLADGTYDSVTTELLAEHQGHYHFGEISQRFIEHGTTAKIVLSTGEVLHSRVSLHYSHLGASTADGSRVMKTDNLFVVGDAGGFLHWSGHRPRLPGFALTHCLVSAQNTATKIKERVEGGFTHSTEEEKHTHVEGKSTIRKNDKALRKINTEHAIELEFGDHDKEVVLKAWEAAIETAHENELLRGITVGIINAWEQRLRGEQEPIPLKKEGSRLVEEEARELIPLRKRL